MAAKLLGRGQSLPPRLMNHGYSSAVLPRSSAQQLDDGMCCCCVLLLWGAPPLLGGYLEDLLTSYVYVVAGAIRLIVGVLRDSR